VKADSHHNTRRAFIRGAAGTVIATVPVIGGIAALPAARATLTSLDPAAGSDAVLIAAERDLLAVHARLKAVRGKTVEEELAREHLMEPLWLQLDELAHLICTTPAATLAGATVKLRRLCCPNLGIEHAIRRDEITSLRHALAVVEKQLLLSS